VTINGGDGGASLTATSTPTIKSTSPGGDSYYGYGGDKFSSDAGPLDGQDGEEYGAGGAGGVADINAQAKGGSGANGIVIVRY